MTLYHLTDDESGALLGTSFTASREGVDWVMSQPIGDDGRSEFMWLRLSNGDLVLGVYPRGDSGYFGCEATVEADYAAATMGRSHPEWPANEGVELGCDDPHCGVCYRQSSVPELSKAADLIGRKLLGHDCTEDESAWILGYFDRHHPATSHEGRVMAHAYPLENDQWWSEVEAGERTAPTSEGG